jgi:RNA polymerase sigma factor (sigma-70 family)
VSIDGSRSCSTAESDDDALLAAVRAGDRDAYGVLYARHAPSARRYARSLLANDPDADDAVGEVFAHLLQAIERGRGPDHTFAAYLFASVRHECVRIERRRSREAVERAERRAAEPRAASGDHAAGVAEAAVVRAAFASLPGDMRDILRLTEVDQLPQQEIATRLDEDPGTVATRAMRARRALGSAYLRQHVGIGGRRHRPCRGCDDTQAHIASFLRGTAGARRRARIEEHLMACAECRAEFADLRQINGHLRSITFAVLAALRAAGETAWSHLSAVVAASAAPLAATGVITATTLAPVVLTPPPPAPPAVVVDAPVRAEVALHLPPGVGPAPALPHEAHTTVTTVLHPAIDARAGGDREPSTGASAPPVIAEDVTVLPPVPDVTPPDAEVAAAPAPDADPAVGPAAGASPSAPTVETPIGSAPPPPSATAEEPPPAAEVPAPEPTPAPTSAPAALAPATVPPPPPPPSEPPASDDGGAATTVQRKDPKGVPKDVDGGAAEPPHVGKPGPRAENVAAAAT